MAASRHTIVQLHATARVGRQQCQIELAHFGMLHRKIMEDAMVRLDSGPALRVWSRSRIVS